MSMVQEKMYMDVDDVCAILGVSKAYAYNLMREYNKDVYDLLNCPNPDLLDCPPID